MNVYQDISLLPGADISLHFLWEKVYKQIHLGLVDIQMPDGSSPIGIAFPEYDIKQCQLGAKLRLFSPSQSVLENFNAKRRLNCLNDYVHITSIRDVPGKITSYIRYKRKQSKSCSERLARRKAKRENIKFEEALQLLNNRQIVFLKIPFIKISSGSSGKNFCIFITQENTLESISNGFSCYGLSPTSTLPNF